MFVYPYKAESESARALATALEAKLIKLVGSKFRGSKDKIVINWGNTMTNEELEKASVLNHPNAVKIASNKLEFFRRVSDHIPVPEWTTERDMAEDWSHKNIVVIREILNGHSGKGIVITESHDEFLEYVRKTNKGQLYTKYIPKKDEYRLHVVDGEVVDVQRKARDMTQMHFNWQIRNRASGFIFVRNDVVLPDDKLNQYAIDAVKLCDLHFGAVDIIWNNYRKQGYVLEVNTAPGLQGQTIENYTKALKKKLTTFNTVLPEPVRPSELSPWARPDQIAPLTVDDFPQPVENILDTP